MSKDNHQPSVIGKETEITKQLIKFIENGELDFVSANRDEIEVRITDKTKARYKDKAMAEVPDINEKIFSEELPTVILKKKNLTSELIEMLVSSRSAG